MSSTNGYQYLVFAFVPQNSQQTNNASFDSLFQPYTVIHITENFLKPSYYNLPDSLSHWIIRSHPPVIDDDRNSWMDQSIFAHTHAHTHTHTHTRTHIAAYILYMLHCSFYLYTCIYMYVCLRTCK